MSLAATAALATGAWAQPVDPVQLLAGARLDPQTREFVARLPDGRRAATTLDVHLQTSMERLLDKYQVPYGAVVAIEPSTGRILAAAEHGTDRHPRGSAFNLGFPAASIFKIVSGAALIEAGIAPEVEICFRGGKRSITEKLLVDHPRLDRSCATFEQGMAHSINMVFAKLALKHLEAASLRGVAERFLFNGSLAFSAPQGVAVSPTDLGTADVPENELGLAQTAAGFGPVQLTPLHAAWLTAAVANGGAVRPPSLVAQVEGAELEPAPQPPAIEIVSPETAEALTSMMVETVKRGTARQAFRERRRWVLGSMPVAGKTGSLFGRRPFRDYTWFVGFAPADAPEVAVAVLVENGYHWRIRAPYVGREAMREFFAGRGRRLAMRFEPEP